MRFKFNKKIEFFLKNNFLPQSYLFKKRIERSIKNSYEAELKIVKEFIPPGTDTIDIGVYRGVYSYEMSKYSRYVHAFEPNPIIFKDIEKNLKKIIQNIKLYNVALSNKEDLVTLKIPIRNKNFNKKNYEEYFQMGRATIHDTNIMNEVESYDVVTKKLDNFNFTNKINYYYSKANLVITRSGASVLGELVNVKLPFISIPLPSSADNHQYKNAEFYKKKGLGYLLDEKNIKNQLFDLIISIFKDKNSIKKVLSNQRQYSDKNIFSNLNSELQKILNDQN